MKEEAKNKKPYIEATNAIVGDNNTGNYQGQDFEVLPQSQPMTSPSQKATQSDNTEAKMSKAQFIFWLFSAFVSGAAIAIAISSFLKK